MRKPVATATVLATLALLLGPAAAARADIASPPRILSGTIHASDLVLGPDDSRTFFVTFDAEDDSGISRTDAEVILVPESGPQLDDVDPPPGTTVCTPHTANPNRSTCRFTFTVRTAPGGLTNSRAGLYKLWALVAGNDWNVETGEGITTRFDLDRIRIKRKAQLTFDAFPEPPRPGHPLGIVGRLTLADWDNGGYTGAPAGLPLQLVHKADDSSRYEYVADLTTGRGGTVATTTPPRADGIWWLAHNGTDATPWIYSAADHVDMP
ncbi:hypothetical protein ACGFYU_11045 [Streptomyces sp. NPDC048337]|uniref:hypothetical protein n=1 Tax=Streptomyces sp. NPDC048337 TaxID=3365535 RepID=UPI00371768A3